WSWRWAGSLRLRTGATAIKCRQRFPTQYPRRRIRSRNSGLRDVEISLAVRGIRGTGGAVCIWSLSKARHPRLALTTDRQGCAVVFAHRRDGPEPGGQQCGVQGSGLRSERMGHLVRSLPAGARSAARHRPAASRAHHWARLHGSARQCEGMVGTIRKSLYRGGVRHRRPYGDRLGGLWSAGNILGGWARPSHLQVHLAHDTRSLATRIFDAYCCRPSSRRVSSKPSLLAVLLALCLLAGVPTARALDANGQLEDPVLQARYERITKDLRCLVCQNESIADSNVELASDLRRQVREMLSAGKSDDAIFDFMTDRYGEFVRFNPPLEPKTLLIWGAPFLVLILGVVIIFRIVRRRSRMPLDDEPASG